MNPGLPLLLACIALPLASALPGRAAEAAKTAPAPIYDETADGEKQIADALAEAKAADKRVLLQFGANWCGWCHKLHKLFDADPTIAEVLKRDYVVVLIDVNKGHNKAVDEKYGRPTTHGLPVIVILDAEGKKLVTQDTGQLEIGSKHDPEKVLGFLREWAPIR